MTEPTSRSAWRAIAVTSLSLVLMASVGTLHAEADPGEGVALNGSFDVVSDGEWAKTNERLDPRPTVSARWVFESTCSDYQSCTGTVISNQGWTSDTKYVSNVWYVRRTLEGWQQCPDGSSWPGHQTYTFWRDPENPATLIGWDKTVGVSGACGINRWLSIKLPLLLTPG